MATHPGRRRSFPALVIVPLLFLFCLFPGQGWMAHFLPGIAGLATIDPSLTVLDTHIRSPVSIDLILVPAIFLLLYIPIVLIDAIRRHGSIGRNLGQRVAAVLSGTFFLLVCVAIGGLISYMFLEQMPGRVQNSFAAVGMNADIHLPFLGYNTNSLHGNILSLLGLLVGIGIFIGKIDRDPRTRRTIPLTREQRMTPYQRMLHERRHPVHQPFAPEIADHRVTPPVQSASTFAPQEIPSVLDAPPSVLRQTANPTTLCHNEPLQTLEPEAVNYRPLG